MHGGAIDEEMISYTREIQGRLHKLEMNRFLLDGYIGVGCHLLLQCMKVKSEREVAQSCPTLSNPMDCSLPK